MNWHIPIELVAGFVLLFIMTKILGKTSISQITPFEFISSLILGELVGNAAYDPEVRITQIFIAVVCWGTLLYMVEKVELKVLRWRRYLEGNPSIVIRNGQIDRKELARNHLSLNQLQNMLRQKDAFSVSEVNYAILEPNGQLSVLKHPRFAPPTAGDMNLKPEAKGLPVTLIVDGEIQADNLRETGKTESWLRKELSRQGVQDPRDIMLAEWQEGRGFFVSPKRVEDRG